MPRRPARAGVDADHLRQVKQVDFFPQEIGQLGAGVLHGPSEIRFRHVDAPEVFGQIGLGDDGRAAIDIGGLEPIASEPFAGVLFRDGEELRGRGTLGGVESAILARGRRSPDPLGIGHDAAATLRVVGLDQGGGVVGDEEEPARFFDGANGDGRQLAASLVALAAVVVAAGKGHSRVFGGFASAEI